MKALDWLSRTSGARRAGKSIERGARAFARWILVRCVSVPPNRRIEELTSVRSILVVRPNFRIGNTILTARLLPAVQARFPGAAIDWLGGDLTAALLEGLSVRRVHVVSRRFILAPWRMVTLLRRLRRERFDLAIDGGGGTLVGGLYARLAGARDRIGYAGQADWFFTVRLDPPHEGGAYGAARAFATALGLGDVSPGGYHVRPDERSAARELLRAQGVAPEGRGPATVAVFIGGHLAKRWPAANWAPLLRRLHEDRTPLVVLAGSEEAALARRLAAEVSGLAVVPPQPLRLLAAIIAEAAVLVTPDSGPLHLAAALGVPTIVLLQEEGSRFFVPAGNEHRVLWRPDPDEVEEALRRQGARPQR